MGWVLSDSGLLIIPERPQKLRGSACTSEYTRKAEASALNVPPFRGERHLLEWARERARSAAEQRRLREGALDVAAHQESLPPRRV